MKKPPILTKFPGRPQKGVIQIPMDPNDPKDVPGHIWEQDGVKYRRAKNGQCQRFNHHNQWVLCQDPNKPPTAFAIKRAKKALKEGRTPFMESLPMQDRLRMRLREVAARIDGPDAPTRLTSTLAGVQSLSFVIRHLEGGRIRFIELVQLAALNENLFAKKFYAVYADLEPYDRMNVNLDDVCAAAGITPHKLMGALVEVGMEQSIDTGNLVAAALHPGIVKKGAESASRIVGEYAQIALEDRRMMFLHHNFIPAPRGTATVVNVSANAKAAAAAAAEPTVPKFAADMQVEKPQLPSFLQTKPLAIDGEVESVRIRVDPDDE